MEIAIITGASSGMGREFTIQLDQKFTFDEVWIIARRTDRLIELSKKLKNKARIFTLDLSKEESIVEYKEALKKLNPTIKFLVNCAGFGRFGNYDEVDCNVSLQMIDVNCKALVAVTMNSLEYLDRDSHIINLGSASSFFPLKNLNVYASTKAFTVHYSNALHNELKERGISCTVVCPGWVRTEFFDVAKNTSEVHGPKAYKPMLEASDVVKKAIKDSIKKKKFSVYNWYTRLHRFGARFFPRAFMEKQWNDMQKKNI